MSYYKVEKTDRLEGEIKIQGAKNSALPIIIGSILAGDIVSLYNCPDISDVRDWIICHASVRDIAFLNEVPPEKMKVHPFCETIVKIITNHHKLFNAR